MKSSTSLLLTVLICASLSGCHCCGWSHAYNGLIDDLSDCDPQGECWYAPGWDLTRIGQPDGLGANRCGRYCRRPPAPWCRPDRCTLYPPNPGYVYPVEEWSVYRQSTSSHPPQIHGDNSTSPLPPQPGESTTPPYLYFE